MILLYAIPITAWLAFVYVQHYFGDRPTTYVWMAFMTAVGVFEYGKCVFALVDGAPSVTLAAIAAAFSAGVIVVAEWRARWIEDMHPDVDSASHAS